MNCTMLLPRAVDDRHVINADATRQGDGIGAEVSESVRQIFKSDNVPVEWEQIDVSGMETGDKHTEDLFRESIASLKRNKIGLKGMLRLLLLQDQPTQSKLSGYSRLQQAQK